MDIKDVLTRAFKTAVEVFVVALPAGLVFSDAAAAIVTAKAAGLSAAAAGAAVVLNAILAWAQS